MYLLRSIIVLFLTSQLTACFQVELIGPVSGASVSIIPLRGGAPVYSNLKSSNVARHRAEQGAAAWNDFSPFVRLLFLGTVDFEKSAFNDKQLYLVSARGGTDMDSNSDKKTDNLGSPVQGELHAIMTGAQLTENTSRVSLLTEAFYRSIQAELSDLSNPEILAKLNHMAVRTVSDLNEDGGVDYFDALIWSNITRPGTYKGPKFFLRRLAYAVSLDLDESIVLAVSDNLVKRARWRAVNAKANYASSLVACTTPVLIGDLCTFGRLPIIGMNKPAPVVADIMDRLVVSHPWMGNRFKQVLNRLPEDILLLLRSVTSIVIDADTRPSYYSPATATIYLDADSFWLTEKERKTVSTEPDYRADFSDPLGFWEHWRYVKNNDWAYAESDDVDVNGNRQLDDVVLRAASLLFHELAHANDFFSFQFLSELPLNTTPYDTLLEIPSDLLSSSYPLQSLELAGIADVLYFGAPATARQAAYSGSDIGDLFESDRASDLYAYSDQFEDLAMLFEEAMLQIHFGIQRDLAFGDVPYKGIVNSCSDLDIAWGTRGRIGAKPLNNRLKLVLRKLLPERNYGGKVDNFPAPHMMDSRRDWCENIVLGGGSEFPVRLDAKTEKPSGAVSTSVTSRAVRERRIRPYL